MERNYFLEDFIDLFEKKEITINPNSFVAQIGSRKLEENEVVMEKAVYVAKKAAHDYDCKIVTGGAYGIDCTAIAGALDISLKDLLSKDQRIIPIDSRKIDKVIRRLELLMGERPIIDTESCMIYTDRLIVMYPDFSKGYNVNKYFERDKKIATLADIMFAFWDGASRGTKKTIEYASELGKIIYVILC